MQNQVFRFLDLPVEIRNNIYEHVCSNGINITFPNGRECNSLLIICKQIYNEAIVIYYKQMYIDSRILDDICGYQIYKHFIDSAHISELVRTVNFEYDFCSYISTEFTNAFEYMKLPSVNTVNIIYSDVETYLSPHGINLPDNIANETTRMHRADLLAHLKAILKIISDNRTWFKCLRKINIVSTCNHLLPPHLSDIITHQIDDCIAHIKYTKTCISIRMKNN